MLNIKCIHKLSNSFDHSNAYKVMTISTLTNLQNTVAATKSFAAISQKKQKLRPVIMSVNYYY